MHVLKWLVMSLWEAECRDDDKRGCGELRKQDGDADDGDAWAHAAAGAAV